VRTRDLHKLIRSLSLQQKKALQSWLPDLIRYDARVERRRDQQSSRVMSKDDNKTYRQVSVRCGKESCKCNNGKLHGPYWYAYWSEKGKTRSLYIGKKLPKRKPR
jgi:hypothetical protein